jgi:hypothetical protein
MGALFQDDAQLSRFRSLAIIGKSPQEFRRRAVECRELADTCLTSEAQQVLLDLASGLNEEADKLEARKASVGGGRY